jgi:microcin C transport system permease protein
VVAEIERAFGFDKPAWQRFGEMLSGYLRFDLGRSLFRDRPVWELILDKLPVSISLGLWSTLIIYAISIPLGIRKAVRDGSRFDLASPPWCWWATPSRASCSRYCWWCSSPAAASSSGSRCAA